MMVIIAAAQEVVMIEPTGFGYRSMDGDGVVMIYDMQDMTPEICQLVSNGANGTLRDIRDNKVYWVSKMNDGNCWMSQNLDLDLHAGKPLTSDDSDVNNTWTPNLETYQDGSNWQNVGNLEQSYDPGFYVYTQPTITTNCANTPANCTNLGWTNVEGMMPSNDPAFTSALDHLDNGQYIYNAHYTIGNHYSWAAATAGSGVNITEGLQSAPSSICPKGWELPTQETNTKQEKSFTNLFASYNIAITEKTMAMNLAPLYYVGYGLTVSGSTKMAGHTGYYWTATAASDKTSYAIFINQGMWQYGEQRFFGLSVRCIAK